MNKGIRIFFVSLFMIPVLIFVFIGEVIAFFGYPFAVIGSLFGDDGPISFSEYGEMLGIEDFK